MSLQGEESEIHDGTETNEPTATTTCDKMCLHQGDRICYNDFSGKELLKKVQDEESLTSNSTETLSQDSIHSGESLFKTFTFDVEDNDPDIEKCMSFWKSILEKNVKPVKCTLLKPKGTKEKVLKKDKTETVAPCDQEDTQKMWEGIYKNLQRRNLDKIKLVKKQKCDPCDEYIDEEYEKKQDTEDIKKLNDWKSQNNGNRIDIKSQIRRTLGELQAKRASREAVISSENVKTITKKSSKPREIYENPLKSKQKISKESKEKLSDVMKSPSGSIKKEKSQNKLQMTMKRKSLSESLEIETKTENLEMKQEPKKSEEAKSSTTKRGSKTPSIKSDAQKFINKETISETSKLKSITSQEATVCCSCGCKIEECVCEDIEEIANQMTEEFDETCVSCNCESICVCDDNQQTTKVSCKCGCGISGCVCEKTDGGLCKCGCSLDECICNKLDEIKKCSCECGLDDCICEELFTRSCKCGHADCNCDIIEILSTYMETLHSGGDSEDGLKFASKGAQTEGVTEWTTIVETQQESTYCVICGHFNCFCQVKKASL